MAPLTSGKGAVTCQAHFILMGDLTGQLKNSRVLDIRMGTRQYSIDGHWGWF